MLINIQALRFIAALAVVVYHTALQFGPPVTAADKVLATFIQFGYAGVDVFFVISGVIIWHTTRSNTAVAHFAYKRASRIYLGYWPYFVLYALMLLWLDPQRFGQVDLWGSFWLTQPQLQKLLLAVTWTLRYELLFYAGFVVLLLAPQRWHARLLLLVAALVLAVQTWAIVEQQIYSLQNLPHITPLLNLYISLYHLEFLAGCGLAWAYARSSSWPAATWWLLAAAGMLLLTLWYQAQLPGPLSQEYYRPQRVVLFGGVAVCLVAAMLAWERRGVTPWANISLLFGGASYSLYLCHIPLLALLNYSQLQQSLSAAGAWRWLWFLAVVLVAVGYSVAHYRWIEQPLMRGSRWLWQGITARR